MVMDLLNTAGLLSLNDTHVCRSHHEAQESYDEDRGDEKGLFVASNGDPMNGTDTFTLFDKPHDKQQDQSSRQFSQNILKKAFPCHCFPPQTLCSG